MIPFIPAAWAESNAHLALHQEMIQKIGRMMPVSFRDSGAKVEFKVTPAGAQCMKFIDGERSLAEILVLAKADLAGFRSVFDPLHAMDWMLLRRPGSRRMRSGPFLQEQALKRM